MKFNLISFKVVILKSYVNTFVLGKVCVVFKYACGGENLQCTAIVNIDFQRSLLTLDTNCKIANCTPETVCSLHFLISSSQNSLYR